ncbi:DoxX family protein [Terricaulis sp.]|uniref:DoxX family protein n=1 Tax=Terricaulis sp. TaxID=2768686 RepID=UPI0037843E28
MQAEQKKWMTITGWLLSGLVIAFMLMDLTMKFMALPIVISTTEDLGWQASSVTPLAITLTVCTALYAFPRTAVLGAILLTGYLGGAVATHVRIASPLFSHVLFGVYLGVLLWGGLYLRDPRVRALVPLR